MHLEWTLKALGDLQNAGEYIAEDNFKAAKKMAERVQEAVEYLMEHPNMGRPGRFHNTRELVVSGTPYIIPYRVKHNTVEILRVFHSAMQWPETF